MQPGKSEAKLRRAVAISNSIRAVRDYSIIGVIAGYFVLSLLSLMVVGTGLNKLFYDFNLNFDSTTTKGKITHLNQYSGRAGVFFSYDYVFVIDGKSFARTDFFGQQQRSSKVSESEFSKLRVGDSVDLIYNRNDPTVNRPLYERNDWIGSIIFLFLCFGITVTGIALALIRRKNRNQERPSKM